MKHHTLRPSLEEHPLVLLRAIAAAHGIETSNRRSEELVEQLHQHLTRPETIARLLAEMDPATRAALDFLVASGGQLPSHRLQRDLLGGELRQLGAGAMERARPWETPISATERLFYLGLLYSGFGVIESFRGQLLFIPIDILEQLPPVEASPVMFTIEPLAGVPPGQRGASLELVEDAFVVLSDLQRRSVHPVKGRYLPTEALHRINERLAVPEPEVALKQERDTQRLALLLHLLRALNLIEETREGLLKPVTPRARRWLQVPRPRRLLTLQRAWADDPTWNDLWRIATLRPEATGWRNEPRLARAALVRWLRLVPPDSWVSLAEFIKAVKRVDPDFQRPDGDYNSWYIRHAESGQLLHGWENWDQVEGTLLRYFFAGPLFWLGVVELGYLAPSDKQPFAFRLTPYGARWLGHEAELPPQPERAPVIIAADGTITVPPGADDWERLHLERLSLPVEEGPGEYRLDKERLIEELMEGTDVERVIRFLEHATNNFLPEPVRERLRGWAGGYGRITLDPFVVLEVDDPALLRDLQRQPALAQHFHHVLGPRTVAVLPDVLPLLTAALRKAGYLPRISSGEL
ncbi:MAG: helicase-associated domain-containing protein [Ardenticatenales bacterium]|nr:helicase-associated domain-containing protein [Ardenticatenales bacterium]